MTNPDLKDEIEIVEEADRVRGQYLGYVNQIERTIEEKISYCFFKTKNEDFIRTILDDQAVGFYALRAIFINCLKLKGLNDKATFFEGRLQEFGKLRNKIIHGHILTQWDDGVYKKTILRRGGNEGDFFEQSDKFTKFFSEIVQELILLEL